MSAIRDPATITKTGRQMVTAGGDITYTKAVLYGQDISHLTREQLESLTSIGNPLVTVPLGISDKNDNGNGTTVILEATFQNSNLKADLPYTAVGFFAKRGDDAEKLIAVGVATEGAYLAATSPDGVATDALDIKVAIAIGDSANVTAMIDPAGSVTPAALHNAITDVKSEMKTGLDTKADKTDVAKDIDTVNKSISSMSATITANQKATDTALDTKADKTTVNQELATKANSTDVDKKLDKKADTSDVDAKIKVVTDLTNTKANTVDVDSKIKTVTDLANTKANSVDVTAALDKKDDTTDVDAKIKKVTDLANKAQSTADSKVKSNWAIDNSNGKFVAANVPAVGTATQSFTQTGLDLLNTLATKSQVADAKNTANQAIDDYNKRPVIRGNDGDDLLAYKTNQLRLYVDVKNCKNLPPASNTQWFTVEYIFENPNGDGVAIFRSPASEVWLNGNNGGNYNNWLRLANAGDINNLQNAINTKANASDVYTKKQVDDAFSSRDATIATKADKATVDAEISKIDFSPYAKIVDVYSKTDANKLLDAKADKTALNSYDTITDVDSKIKTVTDLANTKVDATYSYSKAELDKKLLALSTDTSGKVNASQVASMIAGKADKTDVDQKIATVNKSVSDLSDTVSANKTATDASLATKANASDVADNVKTLQANIDTKADKATVDAEIAKIDFTPYAKSADVAKDLQGYTTTADLTKLLADKRDIADSYSRDELDKKFLQLSTDTSGKVSADQIAKLLASKVDKTDLTSQLQAITDSIGTKANSANVTAELAKKDNTADVDAKIKTVTDLANTKVDVTYSYSKAELDKKLLALSTDISGKVNATQVASMIADKADKTYVDNQIASIDFGKIKFRKQYVNSDGQTADKTWSATKNDDGTYTIDLYNDDWTASKLSGVLAQLPNKADTTTVNSQVEDAKNTAQSKLDQAKSDLTSLIDNIKNFNVDSYKGRIPSTDMNKITDAGLYGFSNAILTNSPYTGNRWGLLLVIREFNNDPNNIDQFITSNGSLFWRNISLTNNVYPNWKRFADDGDVDGLKDQINTKANASDLSALDSRAVKSIGIYPNDLNFTNGQFTNWSNEMKASPDANGYALIDLTDDGSARAAVDQLNAMLTGLNHLQGKQTKDSADANALSETGVYYCSSPVKNFPVGQWGTLVTSNGNGARASQFYFPDDNSAVWFRTFDENWRGWVRLANIDDVNNAKSSLTSSINAVNNKVNVTVPLFRRITAGNTWNDILGASNDNTPVLVSIRDEGGANTLGNLSAAVAFGGGDTKGVLNVAYSDHTARIIGGNGNAPVWHEDIAWKSDVTNLQNQVNTKASASDVNSLNQTISALQQTVQSLQNTVNQQATQITGLQTQVNNQANEISYIKANYIEGKSFSKSQEAQATQWENANSQRIAFIRDN